MSNVNILVVDKDETGANECKEVFATEFSVVTAVDGDEGIVVAEQWPANFVLLRVGEDTDESLETCRQFKSHEATKDIPIILLTERDSLDDRILSYDAGAYDVITKPYTPIEGIARVKFLQQRRETEKRLAQEAKMASDTALAVMVGNNELGQAIRFVERSYDAPNYHELAVRLLSVTENLGLKCCLFFDTHNGELYFSESGDVSPLEQQLLNRLHHEGVRFKDFGKRTFCVFSKATLLIKNMPLEEPERYGRYKDLFPAMLGAADAKIMSLDIEQALLKQTYQISSSFQQIRDTLTSLSEAFVVNQDAIMEIMQGMISELEEKLPAMGLDEDQETYLVSRIDGAIVEAERLMDQSENLNAAFHHISDLLNFLIQQQQRLKDEVINTQKPPAEEGGDGMADVELF